MAQPDPKRRLPFASDRTTRPHTLTTSFLWKFQTYGVVWLTVFLFSMSNVVISSGLFNVAWFHVVNVTLSFTLFVSAAAIVLCVAIAVFHLALGRVGQAAVLLLCAGLYTFLPFANIVAYGAFGMLGGAVTGGSSFVYTNYIGSIRNSLTMLGEVFGLPYGFVTQPDRWLGWISVISALLGLVLNTLAARRRLRQAV